MKKTLKNTNISEATENIEDLKIVGNGDTFQLLFKVYSEKEGWMKSTKAMEIKNVGCLVQVTTQQGNNIAESLVFVPGVWIIDDINGGKKLVKY